MSLFITSYHTATRQTLIQPIIQLTGAPSFTIPPRSRNEWHELNRLALLDLHIVHAPSVLPLSLWIGIGRRESNRAAKRNGQLDWMTGLVLRMHHASMDEWTDGESG